MLVILLLLCVMNARCMMGNSGRRAGNADCGGEI